MNLVSAGHTVYIRYKMIGDGAHMKATRRAFRQDMPALAHDRSGRAQDRCGYWTDHEPVNRAQEVILRDMILARELIEQRLLRLLPLSDHYQSSNPLAELNLPRQWCSRYSISEKAQLKAWRRCSDGIGNLKPRRRGCGDRTTGRTE